LRFGDAYFLKCQKINLVKWFSYNCGSSRRSQNVQEISLFRCQ
jgi:hypothetical protein